MEEIVRENRKVADCIASLAESHPPEQRAGTFSDMILVYQALKHQARQYMQEEELEQH